MLKIALTGGIGSGKTLVATLFATLGIPVYNADKEAKKIMNKDRQLKLHIKSLLGNKAYHRNGRLDRQYVANKIFGDKKLLQKINSLIHPIVQTDFVNWANKQSSRYVIEESALIFEINAINNFDKTILVTAEEELRTQRVMRRDKVSRRNVEERIREQWPDEKKINLADFVIDNNGKKSLIHQVLRIHRTLISLNK